MKHGDVNLRNAFPLKSNVIEKFKENIVSYAIKFSDQSFVKTNWSQNKIKLKLLKSLHVH